MWVQVPRLPLNVAITLPRDEPNASRTLESEKLGSLVKHSARLAERDGYVEIVVRAGGWPGHDGGRSTVPIGMLRIGTEARPRSPASPGGRWKHRSE